MVSHLPNLVYELMSYLRSYLIIVAIALFLYWFFEVRGTERQERYERKKTPPKESSRNWVTALLLCLFLGEIGAHRFYASKVKSGVLYLCTFGICGIGWLVDLIMILCGKFTDCDGNVIKPQ